MDSARGVFLGTVHSIDIVETSPIFQINYDDAQGSDRLTLSMLMAILLPTAASTTSFYQSPTWVHCRKVYNRIRTLLLENAFHPNDRGVLAQVFGYKQPATITSNNLRKKFNDLSRKWHSDKIGLDSPPWVLYVTKHTLLALRFLKESFQLIQGTEEPSVDPPALSEFPAYRTESFRNACGLSAEIPPLSQDDEGLPTEAPSNNNSNPMNNNNQTQPNAAHNAQQAQDNPGDSFEYVDLFPLSDFFISPFQVVDIIPPSLASKWARVFARVTTRLIEAINSNEPNNRDTKIATALRWYGALPQVFFRDNGRNKERTHRILEVRLDQFLGGEFSMVINHWRSDRMKRMGRTIKSRKEIKPIKKAIDLVYDGFISRATSLLESFGRTSCDIPAIHQQMLAKHPQFNGLWDTIPQREDGADTIDLSHIHAVIHELDPKVGVGTRNFHADHISKLLDGRMTDPESCSALPLFIQLGVLYLNCTIPSWARILLGGGLLTPLNKSPPGIDGVIDARPVKAEDSDTSVWCKALQRAVTDRVRATVIPQQLGVGISSGVQLYTTGLKLKYEEAKTLDLSRILLTIDIENGHNSFDRGLCRRNIISAVENDPTLAPLLLGLQATIGNPTPIYTRTDLDPSGIKYLCDSSQGGGQGNALTGPAFCLTIDSTLKETETLYPGIEVRAIQDDITIFGDPLLIFGEGKALSFITDSLLANAGCTPKLEKFKVLGTLPHSCDNKPAYVKQPSVQHLDPHSGVITSYFGLEVCGTPIGEDGFIRDWLSTESKKLSATISTMTEQLKNLDLQVAHTVLHYSLQNRSDFILSTNLPSQTLPFTLELDNAISKAYASVLGPELLSNTSSDPDYCNDPKFTSDRFLLKSSQGGGGFRPLHSHRAPFLNCMHTVLPQALSIIDRNTNIITFHGLWPSLQSILGEDSFHPSKRDSKWQYFYNSGSRYGTELREDWLRLQAQRQALLATLSPEDNLKYSNHGPLICSPESFGGGGDADNTPLPLGKLHKSIFDSLQTLRTANVTHRALQLPRSDPRRMSFLSSCQDKFSNAILKAMPTRNILFSHHEFQEAVATHFGIPSPICHPVLGQRILNNPKCTQLRVDRYGYNLKTITGATGDHIRTLHDNIVATISSSLSNAAISHRGGPYRTCKDLFSHLIPQNLCEENDRHLQGIIPDLMIDATRLIPFTQAESLQGVISLVDAKTLAPGLVYSEHSNTKPNEAVEKRSSAVNTQYHRHAHKLDRNLHHTAPGTLGIIEQELNTYGHSGRVLGAVVGAFSECSKDIYTIRDLIAHCQALRLTDHLAMDLTIASGIFKHQLTHHWGLTFSRGWARLLLQRRRDLLQHGPASTPSPRQQPHHRDNYADAFLRHRRRPRFSRPGPPPRRA